MEQQASHNKCLNELEPFVHLLRQDKNEEEQEIVHCPDREEIYHIWGFLHHIERKEVGHHVYVLVDEELDELDERGDY